MQLQYALAIAAIACTAVTCEGRSEVQHGIFTVTDGDTVRLYQDKHYRVVRLAGMDAPELAQTCMHDEPMGVLAHVELQRLAHNKRGGCLLEGYDKYDRYVGRCWVDGLDLGRELVRRGYAFTDPWRPLYWRDEDKAIAEGLAVHKHKCERPWLWRKRNLQR